MTASRCTGCILEYTEGGEPYDRFEQRRVRRPFFWPSGSFRGRICLRGSGRLSGRRRTGRFRGGRRGQPVQGLPPVCRKPDGTILEGCFETVSLSGTAEEGGEHLHASLSDPEGNVVGGHVLEGCVVRTTMEIILGSSRSCGSRGSTARRQPIWSWRFTAALTKKGE